MYKIEWREGKNYPLLNDKTQNPIIAPRPVYFEELDLLGFDKHWNYPKCEEPLLWEINRIYYYNGEKVAKAKGGNLYEAPNLEFYQDRLSLNPVDLSSMVSDNLEQISTLKNEAIEFIKKVHREYLKKVKFFVVAFSGGKDSQVLLDLVTIALQPEHYKVIFTDTTMELSDTYKTVKESEDYYRGFHENFKIETVRNETEAEELWKTFGPPSSINRWCCSVYKTSPVYKFLKDLNGGVVSKVFVFTGVRREESAKRKNHERIADGVKHSTQINGSPIIDWNDFEVYLYLYYSGVKLNSAYRNGLDRVGCSICPFASSWNEFIMSAKYRERAEPFVEIVENTAKLSGVKDIKRYIGDGKWKARSSNREIETINSINFDNSDGLTIDIEEPKEDLFQWLKVLGDYKVGSKSIDINLKKSLFNIDYAKNRGGIKLFTTERDKINLSHLKKVSYKTSYCVNCGSCEAECPTGALSVFPKVEVNSDLCIHCSKCLDFNRKGCVMADSLSLHDDNSGGDNLAGLGSYQGFGLQEDWLNEFFSLEEDWFNGNSLGSAKVVSMKVWLSQAEIINGKNITEMGRLINSIPLSKNRFSIILINLYHNSKLIEWYFNNVNWGVEKFIKSDFMFDIKENYPNDFKERSVDSGLISLFKLFETTPLGNDLKLGVITKKGNIRTVQKIGTNNVSDLAIIYSIYKLKEITGRSDFQVNEFYNDNFKGGPYKLFGIDKDTLIDKLKFTSEATKLFSVNLVQGLDNIFLKDFTSIEALKEALKHEVE